MTHTLLVAGTASHVGKSTVAAGLCRLLADRGVSVAPFKAQNMSNNARAVLRVGGDGTATGGGADESAFGEIGVSQYVQARAARVSATTDHNPVLLKPRGDGESQVVIQGEAVGHYAAGSYYDDHWERARAAAVESYERLAGAHDVVVAEGAGSIAEINLHERDLANVETARASTADVLLVADIERGGVFASLVGTLELMPTDLRERVVGAVVTKFRGERSVLDPGIEQFEARTGVSVLGVVPYDDPGLPEEDSVSLPAEGERAILGAGDGAGDEDEEGDGDEEGDEAGDKDGAGVTDAHTVTVAVPRLPRVSNFTDFEPLAREPGVRVAYVPLDADLREADAVVLPGTKNAADDLLAAREAGLDRALAAFDGPVVGLCGGFQLLGERLTDAAREGTGDRDELSGFGLLPVETRFAPEKCVRPVTRELRAVGPLAGARADAGRDNDADTDANADADTDTDADTSTTSSQSGQTPPTVGSVSGYEIHHGRTRLTGDAERPFVDGERRFDDGERPFGVEGAAVGNVLGTYLHGLFENRNARSAFLDAVFASTGRERPPTGATDSPYDRAAALVAEYVAVDRLF